MNEYLDPKRRTCPRGKRQAGVPNGGPNGAVRDGGSEPDAVGGGQCESCDLALRFIAALEEIAACSRSELAGRIIAEGRGSSAARRYNGRKAAPVVRRIAGSLVVGGPGSLRMEEMV